MKKKLLCIGLAVFLLLALAGCGASGNTAAADTASTNASFADKYADSASGEAEEASAAEPAAQTDTGYGGLSGNSRASATDISAFDADKIIYNGYAKIETQNFDDTLEKVYTLIDRCGGFLESSSVNGSNYYAAGNTGSRSAGFTIRVPQDSFHSVMDTLSELGNVPYSRTSAENITTQYRDTEARLTAYKTQETRLLEMLSKANTVEDMLKIQDQLSEVQYNIESLTTQLQGWDSLISYSTIELQIEEVSDYTEGVAVTGSYWGRMGTGFMRSLKNVGDFFRNVFLWLIVHLPVLLLLAALCVIALVIVRRRIRGRSEAVSTCTERRARKRAEREAKKAAKNSGEEK